MNTRFSMVRQESWLIIMYLWGPRNAIAFRFVMGSCGRQFFKAFRRPSTGQGLGDGELKPLSRTRFHVARRQDTWPQVYGCELWAGSESNIGSQDLDALDKLNLKPGGERRWKWNEEFAQNKGNQAPEGQAFSSGNLPGNLAH